jgi:hypothetical protein
MRFHKLLNSLFCAAIFLSATTALSAQTESGYNQPPKNILDVMHAPPLPAPSMSPAKDAILLVTFQDYPSIARVATPFLRLAGTRVEPKPPLMRPCASALLTLIALASPATATAHS